MYFPALKLLNMAENATHNLHNLLPFRGAEVRDGRRLVALHRRGARRFGDRADARDRRSITGRCGAMRGSSRS